MPSKVQLLRNVDEIGIKNMSDVELKRLRKLITKDTIKQNNARALEDQ